MCDPKALAQLTLVTQAVGAVTTAAGTFAQASSARRTASANARLADIAARDALQRGRTEEARHRQQVAQLKGKQRVGYAAGNLALDEGTPLDVITSTDVMGDADAVTIRENADREAYGERMRAYNFRNEARANNPYMTAGSTLIAGAGQVADRWYTYKEKYGGKKGKK